MAHDKGIGKTHEKRNGKFNFIERQSNMENYQIWIEHEMFLAKILIQKWKYANGCGLGQHEHGEA